MLTERQKHILQAIIYEYTQSAHAIGSKSLQQLLALRVSSATIRNEMAVLEAANLIHKAHTSAGRMPSYQGYRYYLDHLMMQQQVSDDEVTAILSRFRGNFHERDDLFDEAVRIMSELTGNTAVILNPEQKQLRVSGFRLVPLDSQQLIAVLVTNDGKVTSQTFRLPRDADSELLDGMVTYINQQVVGQTVQDVLHSMQSDDLPTRMSRTVATPAAFLQLFGDVVARSNNDNVHLSGRFNVLNYGSYESTNDIRALLELLEDAPALRRLLASPAERVSVKVGHEIGNPLFASLSLVSQTFHVPGQGPAIIAMVGPTHMAYERNTRLLAAFGQALSRKMLDYT